MILRKFRPNFSALAILSFKGINYIKLVFLVFLTTSLTVQADWNLDESQSSIEFISIKNNRILERHSFKKLSGSITSEGFVNVTIDLDSVDTKIPIRDQRMRNMLFETKIFPTATFSAKISTNDLELEGEHFWVDEVKGRLNLHGLDTNFIFKLIILNKNNSFRVVTNYPLSISAEDFNLNAGIAALQKIAGLDSISSVVPVILDLVFVES